MSAYTRRTLPPNGLIPAAVARRLQRTTKRPSRDPQGDAADRRALAAFRAVHGDPGPGPESEDVVPWGYRGP